MKKLFIFLLAVMTFAACTNTNEKMSKCENEKLELSFSAEQAACMSAIACNEAKGEGVRRNALRVKHSKCLHTEEKVRT